MRSRVVIVVVALVLGGLAAVMAAQYLGSARSKIEAESRPVEVLVAQQDIARGTSSEELIERKLVSREKVPSRFVASGAVSSGRAIEGQVLAVSLSAGEQLTTGRFEYPSQAGLSYNVPEDHLAVTVPVDEVSGVSGLLKPGDNVAVFVTVRTSDSDQGASKTKLLIPVARVLATGQRTTAEEAPEEAQQQGGLASTQPTGNKSVTLALSPSDAEKVVFASNKGDGRGDRSVWLALLPVKGQGAADTSGQTFNTILR